MQPEELKQNKEVLASVMADTVCAIRLSDCAKSA